MAFTTRSQRLTSFIPQHALETPGPGQFSSAPSDFDKRPYYALAPFSSTSRRDKSTKESEEAPGPGQYFRVSAVSSIQTSSKPSSIFKSKSDRFTDSKRKVKSSESPAPGDYFKPTEWVKTTRRKSMNGKKNDGGIVWVKVSTAPSIPDREQSHGYEEGPSGELIRQRAPVRGYKGTKDDMVGPTDYSFSPNMETAWDKAKGRSAFKSTTKRGIFDVTSDTPAPGQYHKDEKKQNGNPFAEIPVQSSAFASTTKRTDLQNSDPTIGPGSYIDPYKHASSFKKSKIPERYQNFGSSTVRGTTDGPISPNKGEVIPGPGHFLKDTNTIGKGNLFPTNLHGPFGTTAHRFDTQKKASEIVTGPGQYESSSFIDDVQKKAKIGAYGVFGSTSRRFNKMKSHAPGVGVYNPKLPDQIAPLKRNDPRSSVFASKTKRDSLLDKNATKMPAPGEYHKSSNWVKTKGTRMHGEFGTRERRFKEGLVPKSALENPNLAPGRYQDFGAFCRTKNRKNFSTKVTSFSTSPRFNPPKAKKRWYDHTEPAPGSYSVNEEWNKKSFNVTIADT
uniref:Uncharacterized protein n=1 Tax=Percolomonas cosmopolitus TaxID=63605 RepID=A0A7S1KP58_9EUKA|mmetsp:Transcript_3024/g.11617  ORF Transcript_3024/g.11617 Transcript_3024/m.11617 type:complete len:559 (+) Transcript_3024:250-1926(+)